MHVPTLCDWFSSSAFTCDSNGLGPVYMTVGDPRKVRLPACPYNLSFYMIGGVTRQMLPHLSGVPHLHVNRPLVLMRS